VRISDYKRYGAGFVFLVMLCVNVSFSHAITRDQFLKEFLDQGVLHFENYAPETAKQPWTILVYRDDVDVTLSVNEAKTNKELISYSNDYGFSDNFISLEVVTLGNSPNPVILSIWQRGVHGQRLVILDPALGDEGVVFDRTSSWPISFDVSEERVNITVTEERTEIKLTWPPKSQE